MHSHTARFPLHSVLGRAYPLLPQLQSSFPSSISTSHIHPFPTESPCTHPFNASSTILIISSTVTASHFNSIPTIIAHHHNIRFFVQKSSRKRRLRTLTARANRAGAVFQVFSRWRGMEEMRSFGLQEQTGKKRNINTAD